MVTALSACNGQDVDGTGKDRAAPEAILPSHSNLLRNPGFEDGDDPWIFLFPEAPFRRSEQAPHGGRFSALLEVRGSAEERGARVYMATQDVSTRSFPEFIAGYYRVENWRKNTPLQYVQFVVVVFHARDLGNYANHQIRYVLAGIDREPFAIRNARFVFLRSEEPVQGEWVPFRRNLRDDFKKLWGRVPEDFGKIRVLFEARYDGKAEGPVTSGDVFYDDLYLGPARE